MPDSLPNHFYAHGKLLLSGEYFVLDGALSLAIPTRQGQSLTLEFLADNTSQIQWESYDADGACWFKGVFDATLLTYTMGSDAEIGKRLEILLLTIRQLNPAFLTPQKSIKVVTKLEFSRHWGLGSSSTLISCLAQWSNTDPYTLLQASFGGSGYDIACAQAASPIFYQRLQNQPTHQVIDWYPSFSAQLYLVYLGKKQNSRDGIQRYRALTDNNDKSQLIETINQLTLKITAATDLVSFEQLLLEHEQLIAQTLNLPRAKNLYFPDFWGEIKSLGAWGGDFVLATSTRSAAETRAYFNEKGFWDVYAFDDMVVLN
jgi:mevalonate kinase